MKRGTQPIRVLLIDDNLADRELARLALDKAKTGAFQIDFCSMS